MSNKTRQRLLFDTAWHFELGDPAGAEQPIFDDTTWQMLDLPHDWSIAGPFDPEALVAVAAAICPAEALVSQTLCPRPGRSRRGARVHRIRCGLQEL
jgi:hypothetical protein